MVNLEDVSTFDEFLRLLGNAGSIRVVKLNDYGFTAPISNGGAVVIQPMVRLVATAFDKHDHTIYRWQQTTDARQTVRVRPASARDGDGDTIVLTEKDRVRQRLELEGFSVEPGEWTPAGVEALFGRTGS